LSTPQVSIAGGKLLACFHALKMSRVCGAAAHRCYVQTSDEASYGFEYDTMTTLLGQLKAIC
jgi:hypothetical protein